VCGEHRPELTLLLDIDPEIGLSRARARNEEKASEEGRFEMEDVVFYTKIRKGYLELAKADPEHVKVIPANRGIDEIHRDIVRILGFQDGV